MDAYPDLSPPLVEVITQWPGHAAEEVERLITVPVEREMNGLPHLTTLRSISLYGLSVVILTFENHTDNYFARQQAFNRLSDLSLPSGVAPTLSPLSAPSGLIYRYVLQSPDRSPMELKTFEDWTVEPQYRSVPGVADDSGFGGGTMQYQVLLDPIKVASVGLSVAQVEAALTANNDNAGGGFYSQGGQFYYVRGVGRLSTLEDIGNVVVAVHNGTPVLVKDEWASASPRASVSLVMRSRTTPSRESSCCVPAKRPRTCCGASRPRPASSTQRSCRRTSGWCRSTTPAISSHSPPRSSGAICCRAWCWSWRC
jgi:cobalt-zinc-cadmium resistance protein CzcA